MVPFARTSSRSAPPRSRGRVSEAWIGVRRGVAGERRAFGDAVITISVVLTLDIPTARSLKDKRAVVRSLVERLRPRRHVAAAEVLE